MKESCFIIIPTSCLDMIGAYIINSSLYFLTRCVSYFALLLMHASLGHNWQVTKVVSVWKNIPETDFNGIIKYLSVSFTPIRFSTLPKTENNFFCCFIGQISAAPEPGAILDICQQASLFFM